MKLRYIIFVFCILCTIEFIGCTKIATTNTSTDTTTVTPPTDTTQTNPGVKIFNVMDYGNIDVTFNKKSLGSVALYYPYPQSGYYAGIIGTNRITIKFQGNTIVDMNIDLLAGKYYSIFVYRVGYSWKISLVKDDLTLPGTGKAGVRVLDFRTQAYFDYIKVKFSSLDLVDTLRMDNRNFLDHTSYDTYSRFNNLPIGTYTAVVFNDTARLAYQQGLQLRSNKLYSLLLLTKADLSAKDAIYQIRFDWKENK